MPPKEIVRIHASSGTTGKPTTVGYTRDDIDMWAEVMARTLAGAGTTDEDVVQIAYGYGLFTGGLGAHYGAERIGASVIPISGGNTQTPAHAHAGLRHHGPLLHAQLRPLPLGRGPGAGLDVTSFPLRVGVFGAEPWSEAMRREIEQKLEHQGLRHLRALRDHRPGRVVRVHRGPDGPAHQRGPLPARDHRSRDRARSYPTASWANWSSPP